MIPVSEIFGPTVQGEGYLIGRRTMFVRTAGCDGVSGQRDWCVWCDSMHAVDPTNKSTWSWMESAEIVTNLVQAAPWCKEVTISGGNPALHDLTDLVTMLESEGYRINVETQGTVYKPWLEKCDIVTVSPKPPSAGPNASVDTFQKFFATLIEKVPETTLAVVKVVVDLTDPSDMEFAREVFAVVESANVNYEIPCYISLRTFMDDDTQTLIDRYRRLIDLVAADKLMPDVSILPQLHVILWGHKIGV